MDNPRLYHDNRVIVVRGVVVPKGRLGPRVNHVSVYDGPWGYFITKAVTRKAQERHEKMVAERYGEKPLYRINLRRK